MKTITINLYDFDELTTEAQNNAVNNLLDINVDYNWWEGIYNDAENIGLKIHGFSTDRNYYIKTEQIVDTESISIGILSAHSVHCDTYKAAEQYNVDGNEHDFINNIEDAYLTMLKEEMMFRLSREAIIETIKANEYTFEVDGTLRNSK